MSDDVARLSCLCGAVRAVVAGPLREVVACHCAQCRKTSGHFVAATRARADDFHVEDPDGVLVWFRSSDAAERAFCGRCGSHLFWRRRGDDGAPDPDWVSIHAGAFDHAPGLKLTKQIFAEDAGDYYDPPDVPRLAVADAGPDIA